ncbi:MAG: hypothetical protein COU07_02585 [Candidatus Harrisonbacteria bacterium CG10_big_fil_rev_8_21_14_0_10_40_38]|uniref:PsbP C-terminal domain-containing protein n=1 Tax=Candidatus Harrisonbacteria bacterium CG10_big_fil_rev_8_21_14_0_10_40_38 TaxID=1974583 RepID=A0A2H0URP1_9BACT|nr:MAG: hypothetical protein COU07_02585 [Candidatus Harrisonbacteria bacterium CG10_big_fil_rev_8_21_14_0_10_40_38]
MKKTITYAIVIILLIAGGWIIKNATSENSDVAKDFPFESINSINDLENSKLYTSKIFNFRISYPENWIVSSNENEVGYNVSFSSIELTEPRIPNNEAKIEINIIENKNKNNINEWVENFHNEDPFFQGQISASKEILIADKSAKIEIINGNPINYSAAYIPLGNDYIMIITGPEIQSKYGETFLKMLKSLTL